MNNPLTCKKCGSIRVMKCLCFGLPMKLCDECNTGWGIGTYLFSRSTGVLMLYRGSYWKALFTWVFHPRGIQ
jgi:hypothetical protein